MDGFGNSERLMLINLLMTTEKKDSISNVATELLKTNAMLMASEHWLTSELLKASFSYVD